VHFCKRDARSLGGRLRGQPQRSARRQRALAAGHLAAGTLLVAVAASSVNPIDYKVLDGSLASVFPLQFPHTLGNDFVGTVVNVSGSGSERFRVGDTVWGYTGVASRAGPFAGAWASLLAVDVAKVALLPTESVESSSHTDVELATLPCVSLTMYQALAHGASCFTPARKAANRSVVVVTSGQGGTGLVGIQLAKALGASHVVTSAGSAPPPLCCAASAPTPSSTLRRPTCSAPSPPTRSTSSSTTTGTTQTDRSPPCARAARTSPSCTGPPWPPSRASPTSA